MYNSFHFIDENVLLRKRNERRFDRNTCCVNATGGTQGKTSEKNYTCIYRHGHNRKQICPSSYEKLKEPPRISFLAWDYNIKNAI